jgi:tetratricopeptide (TPR) repeat protein
MQHRPPDGRHGSYPYRRGWFPGPDPYYPPYDYGWGYPYYSPYYGPYIAPLFLPSEGIYGPQAMLGFMGLNNWLLPSTNLNVLVVPNRNQPVAGAPVPPGAALPPAGAGAVQPPGAGAAQPPVAGPALPPQPGAAPPAGGDPVDPAEPPEPGRATNEQTTTLAWKFIGYGDAHFGNQRYADANVRYRKATQTAPQLADGWFRQGFAMAAMQRFDLAARSIKRGLTLDPTWPKSDFDLDELYGGNDMAKTAHIDALAAAAVAEPTNADLLFLVGVHLHFDGQKDRAKPFFQRVAQMAGADSDYLRGFLP